MNKKSDQYLKLVKWSDKDQCYVGTAPGLIFGGVHGDDEAEVYKELCTVADEVIAIHEKDGRPLPAATAPKKEYSGKFVLRTGEALHERLDVHARSERVSLNRFCKNLLEVGTTLPFRELFEAQAAANLKEAKPTASAKAKSTSGKK